MREPMVIRSTRVNGTSRTILIGVFVQGEWIVVPDDALILGPNKFGKAIVWLWPQEITA